MHVTTKEVIAKTKCMFNIHADFCENYLVMPVMKGCKADKKKPSSAEAIYAVECMMRDKKALQAGASHYLGDGFVRASDIIPADKDNQPHRPFQISQDVSIRFIDSVVMTHSDSDGLVPSPRIAPTQVIIILVAQHREGVTAADEAVMARLKAAGIRVKMGTSDNSPGWKFAEYEMKGVPLRLELGPKDTEKNQCVPACRDSSEEVFVSLDNVEETVEIVLGAMQQDLFGKAKHNLDESTYACATLEEVKEKMANQGGFAKTIWYGELTCELKMKEGAGVSSWCTPLEQGRLDDTCACCGKPAKHMVC